MLVAPGIMSVFGENYSLRVRCFPLLRHKSPLAEEVHCESLVAGTLHVIIAMGNAPVVGIKSLGAQERESLMCRFSGRYMYKISGQDLTDNSANLIIVPLKAIVDGETIIGPDLSEEEWTDLKLRHRKGLPVRMGCCGAPGHLRISRKGTRHFYHAVDAGCNYAEESQEHLEIKHLIYRICISEQWDTCVEFPAPDRKWISDIYATRDGRKIVFEVQVSTISPDELEERDKKYRAEGIESYWLLDNFLERSKVFASWYEAHLSGKDDSSEETIPYIDYSVFDTGPENHIFIAKGIRSAGLDARNQTLFTTNNPEIPLAVWVREVLKGNYQKYLDETSAACNRKTRLKNLSAPLLIRFREYYQNIIRYETYRKKVDRSYCIVTTDAALRNEKTVQKKFDELNAEIAWLEKEYRSVIAESYGLFTWKKTPGHDKPRLYFRLESEFKIRKLQECITMFNQWEASFMHALSNLEQDIHAGKKMR